MLGKYFKTCINFLIIASGDSKNISYKLFKSKVMKSVLLTFIACFCCLSLIAQHGFPEGHWCNTSEGWGTKRCRALWGMKNDEKHKVITIPHRGVWGAPDVPESCLRSVQEAYEQGYMFVEIDVIMSHDRELVLCHDQQSNRMTSLPHTFSADGSLYDNGSFFRSLNWNSTTDHSVPDVMGYSYPSFPPLKDSHYVDRYGTMTEHSLNTLNDIFDWCKEKEIVLMLDIKTGSLKDQIIKSEYLEAIGLCLKAAEKAGFLHNVIFKPGSAGQVTIDELKTYLVKIGQWENFSKKTNVVLINIIGGSFPLATDKSYLDGWMGLESLIGIEHIYKTLGDELLQPKSEFGNKSIIEYTQNKGFRTGVFHPIPTDERGAPGGRGNYFNPANFQITDIRGSLEFLFSVPENVFPGMIVTDRPDEDMNFLRLFDLSSKYTKQNGEY